VSEWKKCKLGDIVQINYGKSLPEHKRTIGNVPVFSSAGITGWHDAPLVKTHGIILGRKGTIGTVYYSDEPFFCIDTAYYIEPNELKYDLRYLYYLLQTLGLKDLNEDSAVPGLNRNTAYDQDVILPSVPEQRAIAAILSSFDDKIDLLHRQNKTLESLAETLWRKMLDEDSNPTIVNLGEIIDLYDSKRIPLSSIQRNKMKEGVLYPYYGAAKIMDYINKYIFKGEYLLLGEDGTVQTEEGFPILQLATGKFWVNNHTHVITAKGPFNNFLLYLILKKTVISHIITGAVQPKINQVNLKSLEIEIPSRERIEKLALLTEEFWAKIQQNKNQINAAEKLRDTLLPKLMNGEINVEL